MDSMRRPRRRICWNGCSTSPRYADARVLTFTHSRVKKLLGLVGTTLGSGLGWWLGSPGGIMGSFIVSMIGFGVGMYSGARLAQRLDG
jgi:hypothetical protein